MRKMVMMRRIRSTKRRLEKKEEKKRGDRRDPRTKKEFRDGERRNLEKEKAKCAAED